MRQRSACLREVGILSLAAGLHGNECSGELCLVRLDLGAVHGVYVQIVTNVHCGKMVESTHIVIVALAPSLALMTTASSVTCRVVEYVHALMHECIQK